MDSANIKYESFFTINSKKNSSNEIALVKNKKGFRGDTCPSYRKKCMRDDMCRPTFLIS